MAATEFKRYRKKRPGRSTRVFIDVLKDQGVQGMSLLYIGGDISAIQHQLLIAGAPGGTSVDASAAYLEAAKEEAKHRGLSERMNYINGDFVDIARDVPSVDVVTLDRVSCCYHDMEALVGLSSARAT